jgi:hypothetical protein
MHIARPPGGFKIVVRPEVEAYIASEAKINFRIEQFWKDILDRIKITALQESHSLPSAGAPKFSFTANGAIDFGIPTIQIIFECFSDTLTILNALVWTEDDYEDSTYDG